MEYKLDKWFMTLLKKIMEHNNYGECINVEQCTKAGNWTPVDLVLREQLNNGGGSAKGFLGILPYQCHKAYDYIINNKKKIIEYGLVNKDGWNNFGFPLWHDFNF